MALFLWNKVNKKKVKKSKKKSLVKTKQKDGGDSRIWTGGKGVADPCLTTWLCRHDLFYYIIKNYNFQVLYIKFIRIKK